MVNSRQYTAGFNFKGTDQQARIGKLSGGERNRVHLAKLLRSGGNLLLLDEPTNDLDVDTLRALEDALLGIPRLRDGHLPRPLVPGPRRHPRAGLRGRLAGDAGSRATSRPTRSTAARCSARPPTGRTASPTSGSCVAERRIGARTPGASVADEPPASPTQVRPRHGRVARGGSDRSEQTDRRSAGRRCSPPRSRPTGAPGADRTAAISRRCCCAR